MKKAGRSPKTINNHLNFLHGFFAFAEKRGWALGNAVAEAERPRADGSDPDIRFIDLEELEALMREVPDDVLGAVERPLYLTAAMTGLRQGELIALRWKDVDWKAGLTRVRRNYTRGRFGTPKTKRSSRSVPMPERVAAALKEHFKRSSYTGADDLVFCHPETGAPFDASKMRKRFKTALNEDGRRRRAAPNHSGVDGTPRLEDDRNLRRLRTRSGPGCPLGRGSLRRGGRGRGRRCNRR